MTKFTRRTLIGFLLTGLLALPGLASAGETLQRIIDFKVLRVGMSADQPPMTVKNRQGGVMGYDVDLAQALAAAMRVQLDIKVMPFGDLLPALEKGELDMVISNMSITPERSERAYFSGPYVMSGKSILTSDTVLAGATDSNPLNSGDVKLAAVKNSTSATFVTENIPEAELVLVESSDAGVQMVLDGEVNALLADMAVTKLAVLRHLGKGLVTLQAPLTLEPIGIAISREDAQFQNLVDNYLDSYGKMGLLNKLRDKWFENAEWITALP
ncbi:transporter substrate-binding domain-containing protein [Mangrovimicrobium sediminis]|uniref:Transporter substrate-binding domain-containing protein n=1 Tax=Mangrovimicrobium sediminis TaxID=2562682 RepID=A0A4Z0M7X4_9GAMM|nr:transporter substrate-binding domain-containing protein [Haliea sp. SAOS-164]TGD75773.1 transporter substrate-binding domain-containing protein [Haliea sp. SAOS-164]